MSRRSISHAMKEDVVVDIPFNCLYQDVVFKYDASVLSRDTPGPGSSSPFFGGIGDKIKI